ncbi:hypothetical protein HK102_012482, partial [Quaeritorhiza haematococci]
MDIIAQYQRRRGYFILHQYSPELNRVIKMMLNVCAQTSYALFSPSASELKRKEEELRKRDSMLEAKESALRAKEEELRRREHAMMERERMMQA